MHRLCGDAGRFDPLRLSDRGRQAYVYAAEALAVAIGLHVWLTMPWLFKGYLVDYWMLIVMAVAFAGAGLSEWFHRRGLAGSLAALGADGAAAAAVAGGRVLARADARSGTVAPGRPCAGGVVPDGPVLRSPGGHAAFVEVCGTGRPGRQPGSLGRPGLVGIRVPAKSAALRHPAGAGRAGGRISQPRSAERGPERRLPLLDAQRDLHLLDGRHVHRRPGEQLGAAPGADGAVGGRHVGGDLVPGAVVPLPGVHVPGVGHA